MPSLALFIEQVVPDLAGWGHDGAGPVHCDRVGEVDVFLNASDDILGVQLKAAGGVALAQWKFDSADWWVEEHGLIMEKPDSPVPPGKYIVTGDREVTTVLTGHPMDKGGDQRWELDDGATIHDVTHLRCRSVDES